MNGIWRYLLMLAVILAFANTIGALPLILTLARVSKSNPAAAASFVAEPNDPTHLGVDPNTGLIMLLLPFLAGLAAFLLLVKPLHGRSFRVIINGTSKIRWNHYFAGAFVWLVLSAVYLAVYIKINPLNFILKNTSVTLIGLISTSLVFFPFQAALEEILFRGYLMQGLSVVFARRWFPLVVTSVLFGLLHSLNPEVKNFGFYTMMPHYILFGLLFGIITILDDGIEASMGAHAANNIFLSVMVTQESSALQTSSVFAQINVYPWTEFTSLVLTGILFILILKKWLRMKDYSLLFDGIKKPVVQIP